MCGIVGYIGPKQAAPLILEALKKLEYRGYDSSGIAVADGAEVERAVHVQQEQARAEQVFQIVHGSHLTESYFFLNDSSVFFF